MSNTLALANIETRIQNIHIAKQLSTHSAFEAFIGRPLNLLLELVAASSGADTLAKKEMLQNVFTGTRKDAPKNTLLL